MPFLNLQNFSLNEISEELSESIKDCICKIILGDEKFTGLLLKIPFPEGNSEEENLLPVLMTNNHIINEEILNKEDQTIDLEITNETNISIIKTINLNDRMKYTNEEYDITLIEIKENDNININYNENIMSLIKQLS